MGHLSVKCWWLFIAGRDLWDLFQEYWSYSWTLTGTKIHNSPRKISPGSYTTDNIPGVCDRLCKNDNNSDWRKETIHLHTLPEHPFKLPSNNQRTSANHRSDSDLLPHSELFHMAKCIIGNWKVQPLARSGGNFDSKAYISEKAANELKSWSRNISNTLHPLNIHLLILQFFLMHVWKAGEAQTKWQKLEVELHRK